MIDASFTRVFCAAHRVWNDEGKCRNIHGHNYTAEVGVSIEGSLNEQGFVAPFSCIKDAIDDYDHALILDKDDPILERGLSLFHDFDFRLRLVDGPPSTEVMAQLLADRICAAVLAENTDANRAIVAVALQETAGIKAFGEADGRRG